MLSIKEILPEPIHYVNYKVVAPRSRNDGGRRRLEDTLFPVWKGTVESLPKDLEAIIVASDLQGHCQIGDQLVLLGEVLPEELKLLLEIEYPNINPKRTGIFLCGDLFALKKRRGGLGDVRPIWEAFRASFKWVAGVGGNHDSIGENNSELNNFKREKNIYYLESDIAKVDGLRIAGLSGIIGPTRKLNRWEETEYLQALKRLVLKKPDVLLLHEGPDFPDTNYAGTRAIRELLELSPATLVCCGHRHWAKPMQTLCNDTQVLNMEGRALILTV